MLASLRNVRTVVGLGSVKVGERLIVVADLLVLLLFLVFGVDFEAMDVLERVRRMCCMESERRCVIY